MVNALLEKCQEHGVSTRLFLVSEIDLNVLVKTGIEAFVQVSCPRLSIDWAHESAVPLLNSYEAHLVLDNKPLVSYPMDFYAHQSENPSSIGHFNHPKRRHIVLSSE